MIAMVHNVNVARRHQRPPSDFNPYRGQRQGATTAGSGQSIPRLLKRLLIDGGRRK